MRLTVTKKQRRFIEAEADEVLFGGAAGGGKSYGQLLDALLYALKYRGSKQLILRRTFPELDKSLIRVSLGLYPRKIYTYNAARHSGIFKNGSLIDFGYCDSENDVYRYQSAEYDVIRFDELTHFTEQMYLYLLSRLRGANDFPKSVRSSTNPGGVGHQWVKARFVDIGEPDRLHRMENGTRLFIPAGVRDNSFLMRADPGYLRRLENLNEKDRRALLDGDWDIFEGQYFTEWDRRLHVTAPFPIPRDWRRYFTMDYGLDMLAGYWIAVDPNGRAVVYRELYRSGLIISEAARAIGDMTPEGMQNLDGCMAPPDMWNRRQDTGRSAAEIFSDCGINLTRVNSARIPGWYNLKEWLVPRPDETGMPMPNLRIFSNCVNLIRTLPALQTDPKNPNDAATEPHELTHAPDAIRYFVSGRPMPADPPAEPENEYRPGFMRQVESFIDFGR